MSQPQHNIIWVWSGVGSVESQLQYCMATIASHAYTFSFSLLGLVDHVYTDQSILR